MSLTAQEGPDARLPFLILSPSLLFPDRHSFPTHDSYLQAANLAVSFFVAGALIQLLRKVDYLRFPSADLSSIAELVADGIGDIIPLIRLCVQHFPSASSACCIQVVRFSRKPRPLLPQSPYPICSRGPRHRRQSAASPSLPTAATTTMAGPVRVLVPI